MSSSTVTATADPIVATLVGVKGWYEGTQYACSVIVPGDLTVRPEDVAEAATLLAARIGDTLGVPPAAQGTAFRRRFRLICLPLTQEALEAHLEQESPG